MCRLLWLGVPLVVGTLFFLLFCVLFKVHFWVWWGATCVCIGLSCFKWFVSLKALSLLQISQFHRFQRAFMHLSYQYIFSKFLILVCPLFPCKFANKCTNSQRKLWLRGVWVINLTNTFAGIAVVWYAFRFRMWISCSPPVRSYPLTTLFY